MRIVVVTGATSGFGTGLVREFLRNGDRVVATGRRLTSRADIFAAERQRFGEQLIEHDLDLTVPSERDLFVHFCRQQLGGRIDVLVNNAGFGLFGALADLDESQLRHQMEVNYFGLVLLTRDLLPFLIPTRGRIFNLSSVLGFTGFPLTSSYCATKFAVEGFTESLYYELKPHGVQVCLIEPGSFRTGFGTAVEWGRRSSANELSTVFRRQTENYHRMREDLQKSSLGHDPGVVFRGVVRLSRRSQLPLRRTFGLDAGVAKWMKRLRPEALVLRLFELFFRSNINRGA